MLTPTEIVNVRANLATDIRSRFRGVAVAARDALALLDAGCTDRDAILAACDAVTDELEAYLDC